ncbi:hypothetical protein [Halomarina litorea]|nr:hypothetical protein [Halomarina sp. BCD28]
MTRGAECCPDCGSYQVRITIGANGDEIPVLCGQCGWRREE